MNRLFLDALEGKNTSRPPLWVMRQAGRYLPEYQAIRQKHSFLEMCHTPEVAAKVTLTPFARFPMDAAILFSDILMIPEAYNLGLNFVDGVGPVMERQVQSSADVQKLPSIVAEESFSFIGETIKIVKGEIDVPLIGFAGAPFTVASYMVEGAGVKEGINVKKWFYTDPEGFRKFLDKVTEDTINYLKWQIESGVDAVQLFESSLYLLRHEEVEAFCMPYYQKIVEALKPYKKPLILFGRGSSLYWEDLGESGFDALGLDWQTDLYSVRKTFPDMPLQGNIDPMLLFSTPEKVKQEVGRLLDVMRSDPAYICNLGHGILPKTPLASVEALVEAVHTC